MLSKNILCLLDRKIRDKSPDHIFDLNFFWQYATYNFLSGICSEFFDLSSVSAHKKFFPLCYPVFLSFCPCFYFSSFAILKLYFSLQNPLGRQEKQYPFLKIS